MFVHVEKPMCVCVASQHFGYIANQPPDHALSKEQAMTFKHMENRQVDPTRIKRRIKFRDTTSFKLVFVIEHVATAGVKMDHDGRDGTVCRHRP